MASVASECRQRIVAVLNAGGGPEGLRNLLLAMKEEGVPRTQLLKTLTSLEARHRNDDDDTVYDVVLFGIDIVFSSTHPERLY